MNKPIFRMTRDEMHDELLRRMKIEQQNQVMLIAAFEKLTHMERRIDTAFYSLNPIKNKA